MDVRRRTLEKNLKKKNRNQWRDLWEKKAKATWAFKSGNDKDLAQMKEDRPLLYAIGWKMINMSSHVLKGNKFLTRILWFWE